MRKRAFLAKCINAAIFHSDLHLNFIYIYIYSVCVRVWSGAFYVRHVEGVGHVSDMLINSCFG